MAKNKTPGLNIVFVVSEASPLAKTGGLADVAGSLPHALKELGHQLTVIMPFYKHEIAKSGVPVTPANDAIHIWINGTSRQAPLHTTDIEGVRFLLIEQDDLYSRDSLYGASGGAYEDNLLRYTFFVRVALEAAARQSRPVDIFHCHDWQTGLLPMLLKYQYQHYANIAHAKCVYTIHNLAYQGVFQPSWLSLLGIPSHDFNTGGFEYYGQINCMKAGIFAADHVTTVSNTYAKEILTAEYGCHLEGFLNHYKTKLSGIVNGLDTADWNPETDPHIAANYSAKDPSGKANCKADLQKELGLKQDANTPIIAMVSRLAEQKGVDLLLAAIPWWLHQGCQVVVLGSGDPHDEHQLAALSQHHPKKMYFYKGFNETLARKIYAGADIFPMPSRFEPCGLGQLIAMRYGTVPVVRATGGLKDTVADYAAAKTSATGFAFVETHPDALKHAVGSALNVYGKPAAWKRILTRAMRRDSSWKASAKQYDELYRSMLST